ncbi:MAG: cysteine desulfurase NifS [Planctomycetes bacterium]|jgi:cysteine desulfurase|nr:cysteine desulfurase NifS [Planctomycetota bacterium]
MRVYLDHNATTPVLPAVVEAMLPFFTESFGNASSLHAFGQEANKAVQEARERVAALVNADPSEILFLSGGTEADNLAVLGTLEARAAKGRHLVTSAVEHPAVLETCRHAEKTGAELTVLPVDAFGAADPEAARAAIRPGTVLVSVMAANNEVGTLQPVAEIGAACREKGVAFHTDAVQALGKVPVDVRAWNADLASFSAHKIGGPKGVGALVVRKGCRLGTQIHGGHQERGRRAGTTNVAGIVGFGKAAELALQGLDARAARLRGLRDRLQRAIEERIPRARLNGHPERRLPNTLNLRFDWVEGEAMLLNLDFQGIAVSTGSACASGSLEPSHVLTAMGVPPAEAQGALRFSLGEENTEAEMDATAEALAEIVKRLREMSPLAQ